MRTKHLMLQIFYLVLTIFVGLLLLFIAHLMYFQTVCFSARCEEATAISRGFNWSVLNDSSWRCCDLFESQSRQDEVCWELVWGCGTLNSLARQGEEGSLAVKWPTIEKQAFGSFSHLAWLSPELYVVSDWTRYPPISKKLSLTLLSEKRIYSHIPSSLLLSIYRWNNQPYQILWNS